MLFSGLRFIGLPSVRVGSDVRYFGQTSHLQFAMDLRCIDAGYRKQGSEYQSETIYIVAGSGVVKCRKIRAGPLGPYYENHRCTDYRSCGSTFYNEFTSLWKSGWPAGGLLTDGGERGDKS